MMTVVQLHTVDPSEGFVLKMFFFFLATASQPSMMAIV
jgi:hypothetical protein